jgi:ABC-type branched-subunit amino acid transport system ATPase component
MRRGAARRMENGRIALEGAARNLLDNANARCSYLGG